MSKLLQRLAPLRRLDWPALIATLLLLGTGVVFIASAGAGPGDQNEALWNRQWVRQLIFIGIGLPAAAGVALYDYRNLRDWAAVIYGVALLLLAGVLVVGIEINNSRSWYDLKVVNFQPAEVGKLGLVVALAAYLGDPLRNNRHPRAVLLPVALTGLVVVLILMQPDLGTAMILPGVLFAMLFAACVPWRMLGLLLLLGLMSLPLVWSVAKPYQRERILVFLDPDRDPVNAGWNMIQSRMAVGSGGLTGKGLRQGTQNLLGFLPGTVAPTDFIFSVIAEEKGFLGSALLLGLYTLLFTRITRTALRTQDFFGRLLAVGILGMIFLHVCINVAMTIGLMPIVGLPLPLVSYGGSFIVSILLALGLTQSVHVHSD